MKIALFVLSMGALLCVAGPGAGQQKPAPKSPALLELTMEVATTTETGSPAALRFTLKNVGYSAVDLPLPVLDCSGLNGTIRVQSIAHPEGPLPTTGYGHGCGGGSSDNPLLLERIRSTWFHLLPGEYLTFTGDRRMLIDKWDTAATYEYWAEYQPPSLTAEELALANRTGFIVPTEKVRSEHFRYSER